jgi:uncharacterized membrane protein YtjA (UPF0391 family)
MAVASHRERRAAHLSWACIEKYPPPKELAMLYYALVFFIVALVAALFGFGGIAAGAVEIAKILFFVFLILMVISLVVGLIRRGP